MPGRVRIDLSGCRKDDNYRGTGPGVPTNNFENRKTGWVQILHK